MTEHTPGPWVVEINNAYHRSYIIRGGEARNMIAQCYNWQDRGFDVRSEANARLIAAAPELLEALEHMVAMFANSIQIDGYVGPAINQARAAIAKAKGEGHE